MQKKKLWMLVKPTSFFDMRKLRFTEIINLKPIIP